MWNKGLGIILDITNRIDVRIVPYIQCSDNPNIQLYPINLFLEEVEPFNKAILDDLLLELKFHEYVWKNRTSIFLKILPLNNRLFQPFIEEDFR
ncbi:MAG: hypothetical protein LUE99_11410 [Bacteroides sp.]|nr:hypothetical protein [Bacteroides sp.]